MVFVASHWTASSNLRVLVFSNCEEVELNLNGVSLGRQSPSRSATTQYVPHPPFVFDLARFEPGRLEAVGIIGGQSCVSDAVETPGSPAKIGLSLDRAGIRAAGDEPDLLFAHACLNDEKNHLCVEESAEINFTVEGDATLIGPGKVNAEAGIASILLRLPAGARSFRLTAFPSDHPERTTSLNWES